MPGMEDIAQLLQSLLSADNNGNDNPQKNEEETFSFNENDENNENKDTTDENTTDSMFDGLGGLGGLAGMFGGDSDNNFFAGLDFDMLMKIGMIFAQLQKTDKNTALLIALKPMMRSENQVKIDTAMKLVRLMGLLPYLKESGLLNKLF